MLNQSEIPFIHAPHLPLPVAGSLLRKCHLYLGHDSGISHLAAACGLKCLLLFGPTNPGVWAPRNKQVKVIHEPHGLHLIKDELIMEHMHELLSKP